MAQTGTDYLHLCKELGREKFVPKYENKYIFNGDNLMSKSIIKGNCYPIPVFIVNVK